MPETFLCLTSSNTRAELYALLVCPKASCSAVCYFCKEHHHLLAYFEITLLLDKTQNGNKPGLFDQSEVLNKCKVLACLQKTVPAAHPVFQLFFSLWLFALLGTALLQTKYF